MGSVSPSRGFFARRRVVDFGAGPGGAALPVALVQYQNVPRVIGAVLSARLATLHELQTVYGVEDAYDLLEVLTVDAHNEQLVQLAGRQS